MTRNEKRNSRSRTRIGVIVVLGLLVVLVGGYTIRSTYYAQPFYQMAFFTNYEKLN